MAEILNCENGKVHRNWQQGIRRRDFLGTALGAALTVGAASSGPATAAAEETRPQTYREQLDTPIVARYDVVVAGGGPSGVIAALAAARTGANTLLIERYGFLGGNGTAGLMTCYNGFRNQRPPEALQAVKGIPAQYIAEIVRLGGVADAVSYPMPVKHDITKGDIPYCVGFDPEAAKVAALNMLKKEGVRLRLHSCIVAPMLEGNRVTGVIAESKSGRQAIAADIVVDATGDGDIAARAGASVVKSPARKSDLLRMTLMYRLGGVPVGSDKGAICIGERAVKWGPGFQGDGTDVETLTKAEVETRLKLWDQIEAKRRRPGTESVYLMQTATGIGVRETRHILGGYVLTVQNAIEGTRFPDVVAISSNPMAYQGKRYFYKHEGFDVPYRSLVPKGVENVVLTGRCLSAEQDPFWSARAMAGAMAIGHASGCAAAMAAKGSVPPRKLDVKALQNLLLSQNAELRMGKRVT
jgi:hypothetical protein